jgi:hypothetical protein
MRAAKISVTAALEWPVRRTVATMLIEIAALGWPVRIRVATRLIEIAVVLGACK